MKKILAALIAVGICLALCSDAMAHIYRYGPAYRPAPAVYHYYYGPHYPAPPRYYPAPPPPPAPRVVVPAPPVPVYAPGYYPARGGVIVNTPYVGVHVGW